jgi:hypothetical protein
MVKAQLFTDELAADMSFVYLRAGKNEICGTARKHCEELWEYEPHADKEFLVEIRSSFQSRYWEMCLTSRSAWRMSAPRASSIIGSKRAGPISAAPSVLTISSAIRDAR